MKIHNLKTLPEFFNRVWNGNKKFEIRKNDRDFKEGDFVILQEWVEKSGYYCDPLNFRREDGHSGRIIIALITYVTNYEQQNDYVVFGLAIQHLEQVYNSNPPIV